MDQGPIICFGRGTERNCDQADLIYVARWCFSAQDESDCDKRSIWPQKLTLEERSKLIREVDLLYELAAHRLADSLNTNHGVEWHVQTWKVLFGPWLRWLTHMQVLRYHMLKDAIFRHSSSSYLRCFSTDFVPSRPRTVADALQTFRDESWTTWHFQWLAETLFQDLLAPAACSEPGVHAAEKLSPGQNDHYHDGIFRLERNHAVSSHREQAGRKTPIVFTDTTFDRLVRAWANIVGRRRRGHYASILSGPIPSTILAECSDISIATRETDSELLQVLCQLIEIQAPRSFTVDISALTAWYHDEGMTIGTGPVISSTSWQHNDNAMWFMTLSRASGGRLVHVQSGGGYGALEHIEAERHQRDVSDVFVSWGWKDNHYQGAKVIPVGQSHGRDRLRRWPRRKPGSRIMLVENQYPRYGLHLESTPYADEGEHLADQYVTFLQNLDPNLALNAALRTYPVSYGFDIGQRLKESFQNLPVLPPTQSFAAIERRCGLLVYGYASTNLIRSLQRNSPPCVFFLTPSIWQHRASFAPDMALLQEAGIIHATASAAAAHVNSIYADREAWWQSTWGIRREIADRLVARPFGWRFRMWRALNS